MKTPPTTLVALITPFDSAGSLDAIAHRHNLGALADRGVEGFLIGGSTGQGPYLEPGERATLVTTARATLGSAAFLLSGVSAQSTRQASVQIDEAVEAGADAVLVITPTLLLRADGDLVRSFFLTVADRSALPVFCYTVPAVTGYELPVDVAIDVAGHPNVVGMKDSGGDPDRVAPILDGVPDDYFLFNGSSRVVHETVRRGAYGAITASCNYVPDLVSAAQADEDAQGRLTEITSVVERHGVAGTYAAAGVAGLSPGTMRDPLRPVADAEREQIRRACGPAALQ